MYAKLAIRNIKRSFKDYSIYLRDQHPSAVVIDAIEGNKIEFEDRLTS